MFGEELEYSGMSNECKEGSGDGRNLCSFFKELIVKGRRDYVIVEG